MKKKKKTSIFSIDKMGRGGEVKLKVKNEIVKSKISRLQRKFSKKIFWEKQWVNKITKCNKFAQHGKDVLLFQQNKAL